MTGKLATPKKHEIQILVGGCVCVCVSTPRRTRSQAPPHRTGHNHKGGRVARVAGPTAADRPTARKLWCSVKSAIDSIGSFRPARKPSRTIKAFPVRGSCEETSPGLWPSVPP